MRDAAHRKPCRLDRSVVGRNRGSSGNKRELVRLPITNLEVVGPPTLGARRDLDRDDEVPTTEHVIPFWCIAWETMKFGERYCSVAAETAHMDGCIQRRKGYREI